MGAILFPIFLACLYFWVLGLGSAVIGYDLDHKRRVQGVQEYLFNWLRGGLYVFWSTVAIVVYVKVLGWPTPSD